MTKNRYLSLGKDNKRFRYIDFWAQFLYIGAKIITNEKK